MLLYSYYFINWLKAKSLYQQPRKIAAPKIKSNNRPQISSRFIASDLITLLDINREFSGIGNQNLT